MTQAEFTNRTNVEVTYNEFEAINEVYMNSDLDKDEFCKMWCKMNASRVAKAKAAAKALEEEMDNKWMVANLYWTILMNTKSDEFNLDGSDVLSKTSKKRLEELGIKTEGITVSNMLYEMENYYKG